MCMLALFFSALFIGHLYIIIIVTAIQIITFKEVIAIANVSSRARSLRSTKSLNWYWLATTMYFLYGESVIYYFKHIVLVDKVLLPLATHHRFISFILYVFGMWRIKSRLFAFSVGERERDTGTERLIMVLLQDSSSSWHRFRPATTSFSSPTLHGRTWHSTSSLFRHISS